MRLIHAHYCMEGIIQRYGEPLGLREIKPGYASRGDIALRDCGNGDTAGIVIGSQLAYVGKNGLLFANLNDGVKTRYWKF